MKKVFIASLLLMFSFGSNSYSSDTSSVKFMPLAVGNFWVYKNWNQYFKVIITKDTMIANRKYFYTAKFQNGVYTFYKGWYRTDTVTGSLYRYDSANSCIFYDHQKLEDSLAQNSGILGNCSPNSGDYYMGSGSTNFYGFVTVYKRWGHVLGQHTWLRYYAKYLGYLHEELHDWGGSYDIDLVGCYLSGVVYGDTTLPLGLSLINSRIPQRFSLFQNYPNPFNPITKIKFDIPKLSFTKLIIYDLLGREMALLVNEELKPGSYEAEWDASNYSSGIYIYQLIADKFVETKKMVLTK